MDLQTDTIEPIVSSLVEQTAGDCPGCVLLRMGWNQEEQQEVFVTRWKVYPMWWENGYFGLSYSTSGTGWKLKSTMVGP